MSQHSKLYQPYTFRCGATANHRITLAPLTNEQSHDDGICSDEEFRWLERRAAGGFSIVPTCASHVSPEGKGFNRQLGCFGEQHIPGLRKLATAINQHKALSVVQLYHGGARSASRLTGVRPFSATEWIKAMPGVELPRAATEADIVRVIDDFCKAAHRACTAGFSGIEIHGAHGYLLSQFLSTLNTRTDDWGITLENRARLIRTITQRIRSELPSLFVVGVRLSPENFYSARGIDLDESVQVAKWLAHEDGADYIHLSLWDSAANSQKYPHLHAIPLFRNALSSDIAIMVAGNIWTRTDAEAALDRGADFVALGRSAMVEPDWPKLAANPEFVPRRPPLTRAEWHQLDVSDQFVDYLSTTFRDMVAS